MLFPDLMRFLMLAAIWGGSFIFLRVLAPVLGAFMTADARLLIAGVALCIYFAVIGFDPGWRKHWKKYLLIGVVNSGIPFTLYSFAAIYIPASYEAILNSTTPLFGTIFAWLWLGEIMTVRKIAGIIVAVFGVGVVVNIGAVEVTHQFALSVLACLGATFCYGLGAVYIKKFASDVKPLGIAGGSQLMAGLVLLPLASAQHITGTIDMVIILNVFGLSLLCSAVAYILYYQLIANIGPAKALTVTFLIPVFGMLWGALFLQEAITTSMIGGTLLILSGTWLVVGKRA